MPDLFRNALIRRVVFHEQKYEMVMDKLNSAMQLQIAADGISSVDSSIIKKKTSFPSSALIDPHVFHQQKKIFQSTTKNGVMSGK